MITETVDRLTKKILSLYPKQITGSISLFYLAMSSPTLAQITPDSTLGNQPSVVNPDIVINGLPSDEIVGGAKQGANLFHSFQQFNVKEGQRAYFLIPNADIQNVLVRVTGSSRSEIMGTLGTTFKSGVNSNPNLFLINPHGVIFGPNARLDVAGSFVATTANAIKFGDHGYFSATEQNEPSVLTVNPSAFLFNQIASQPIISQAVGAGLQVLNNRSLLLVGGNVSLESAAALQPGKFLSLNAQGGRVELGGLAGKGTVGLNVNGNVLSLNFPEGAARADVSLTSASVNVVAPSGGGSIAINARNLDVLTGSELAAGTSSSATANTQAGDITLNATGQIKVVGSTIYNDVPRRTMSNTGNIYVKAGSLFLESRAELRVRNRGQGNTGTISVRADKNVSIVNSSIISNNYGQGKAGEITIKAVSLSLDTTADSIASINASTFGAGNAGNISVYANGNVSLAKKSFISAVAEPAVSKDSVGNAGNISIQAQNLSLTEGAGLYSSTGTAGAAGNLRIVVPDTVSLTNNSNIYSDTTGNGNGGKVDIDAGILSVTGSEVSVSSIGKGMAGNLKVTADSIRLDEDASFRAETTAGSGNISLRSSQDLVLRHGSDIFTNAQGTATGGNITIDTGVIAALEDSDISANAQEGRGGRVRITAQDIFGTEFRNESTPESDITATSNLGPDFNGIVEINTPDVDPTRLLVDLPTQPVNVTGLIAQGCPAGGGKVASQFVVTGRGGLPDNPSQTLSSDTVWSDLRSPTRSAAYQPTSELATQPTNSTTKQLVEAQGWVINNKGEVVLTAAAPEVTPHESWLNPTRCHTP